MSVGLPLHTKSQDQSANLKCHQTPHMSEITMVSGYVSVAVGSHEFSKRGMCQYKKECVTWSSADMSFYKAVPCYLHATWRNDATAMSIKKFVRRLAVDLLHISVLFSLLKDAESPIMLLKELEHMLIDVRVAAMHSFESQTSSVYVLAVRSAVTNLNCSSYL